MKTTSVVAVWIPAAALVLWTGEPTTAQEGAKRAGPPAAPEGGRGIRLLEDEHRIRVEIDGRHFTDYNFGVEQGAPTLTPFFCPLKAPDGAGLASDQHARRKAGLPGADHPHHRGLRFGHLYGNLSRDYWHQTRHHHVRFTKVEGDTLIEELEWEGAPDVPRPEMCERRAFRFISFPDGARGIDVAMTYRPGATAPLEIKPMSWAGQQDLVFALVVIRVAPELGSTSVVTLASGTTVDARRGGAGEDLDVWKSRWIDISGTIDDKKYGVAFIAHPKNPYPTVWRRDYLYWGIQASIEAKGGITLNQGQSLTSRYLVVVHEGDAASARLDEKAGEYKNAERASTDFRRPWKPMLPRVLSPVPMEIDAD